MGGTVGIVGRTVGIVGGTVGVVGGAVGFVGGTVGSVGGTTGTVGGTVGSVGAAVGAVEGSVDHIGTVGIPVEGTVVPVDVVPKGPVWEGINGIVGCWHVVMSASPDAHPHRSNEKTMK